jgi:hypothetical protein
MTTDSNAGDGRTELFVADFYPELGEYLAERHASGYDAVAARARFLIWVARHADKSVAGPPRAGSLRLPAGIVLPSDVMARDALADYIAEAGQAPEPGAGEVAGLGLRIAAGRDAQEALAAGAALTADERAGLEQAADQGRRAKDRLLEAHLRLVADIAWRYVGRGVPFLELVQEGGLGLALAAEKFDDGRGYPFSAYATWWIRQAIMRALADQGQATGIPVHLTNVISEIAEVQRRLLRELGREPTPEELAAELGADPD